MTKTSAEIAQLAHYLKTPFDEAISAYAELDSALRSLKSDSQAEKLMLVASAEVHRLRTDSIALVANYGLTTSTAKVATGEVATIKHIETLQDDARTRYLTLYQAVQVANGPFRPRSTIPWWRREPWASVWVWMITVIFFVGVVDGLGTRLVNTLHENEWRAAYQRAQTAFGKTDYITAIKEWSTTYDADYQDSEFQLSNAYQAALNADLDAKNWDSVRTLSAQYKAKMPQKAKIADQTRNESYYRPALIAFNIGDCTQTLVLLASLSRDPYSDSESYHQQCLIKNVQALIAAGKWSDANSQLSDLSKRHILTNLANMVNDLQGQSDLGQADIAFRAADYASVQLLIAPVLVPPLSTISANQSRAAALQLRALYVPAKAAFDTKQWDAALGNLEQIFTLNSTYNDIATLLSTAYYELAMQAISTQDLAAAQTNFEKLQAINPTFRDGSTQLVTVYYNRAKTFMAADKKQYVEARAVLQKLLHLNASYADSLTLLRDTYYLPAKDLLDTNFRALANPDAVKTVSSQPCIDARMDLNDLKALLPVRPGQPSTGVDYKDAHTLINDSYYCEVKVALANNNYEDARAKLITLAQNSPNFQDIDTLFDQTFYVPAKALMKQHQYVTVRPLLIALLSRERFYQDVFILLRTSYYVNATDTIKASGWKAARPDLIALIQIDPSFKLNSTDLDAQTLYRESYYVPANDAMIAKNWDAAITAIDGLLKIDASYKDIQELHRAVYYLAGQDALGKTPADYKDAQKYLAVLVDQSVPLAPKYKDAYALYEDTFFRPANDLILAGRLEDARPLLKTVIVKFGDYRNARTFLSDTYYTPAVAAFKNGDWLTVRKQIDDLRNDRNTLHLFRDADQLWSDSYLVPGEAALQSQNWTLARDNLKPLFVANPTYKNVRDLYLRSFREPGDTALLQRDWTTARTDFQAILTAISPNDAAIQGSLWETYYQPAQAAIEAGDWQTARDLLAVLLVATPAYKDAPKLYHDSFLTPINTAIRDGNMTAARQTLDGFNRVFPNEQSVYESLLLSTYSLALREAIKQKDWYSAADRFLEYRNTNQQDETVAQLIVDVPELRQAIAARFSASWTTIPATGKSLGQIGRIAPAIFQIGFNANNNRLVSVGADDLIHIWNIDSAQSALVIATGVPWIKTLLIDPRGHWVASSGDDSRIQLWDMQSGQLLKTLALDKYTAPISVLAVTPDGQTLASADEAGNLLLWRTDDWNSPPRSARLAGRIAALEFAPNSKMLMVALADGNIFSLDVASLAVMPLLKVDYFVKQILFEPDGSAFLTLGNTHTISIWSAAGKPLGILDAHTDWVTAATLSADGSRLVSIGDDDQMIFWNLSDRSVLSHQNVLSKPTTLRFSFDSSALAVGNAAGRLLVWQISPSLSQIPVATATPVSTLAP